MSVFRPVTESGLTQSQRADFPESLERSVVDGGVREGRLESAGWPGLTYLVVGLIALLLALGLFVKFVFLP